MKPSKLNYVKERMSNVLSTVEYSKELFYPSIAYTDTRSNTIYSTIYSLYVNDTRPDLTEYLYMHECGHIIFGHCKNYDLKVSIFVDQKIKAGFKKLSRKYQLKTKESYIPFRNMLLNVVMDMEVNSRLFTKEEFAFMNSETNKLLNTTDVTGIWPEDYGFKCELTWNEYLNLILLDANSLKQFFQTYRKKGLPSALEKHMKRQQGQGSGKDSESEKENQGITSGTPKITQQQWEQIKKKIQEAREKNEPLTPEELEALDQAGNEHSGSNFSIPTGTMNGRSSESSNPIEICFNNYTSMEDLCRKVKSSLLLREQRDLRRDPMYNYNRRKYNTNVIIPKDSKQMRTAYRRLFILIDVSGSVSPDMVHNFCKTFNTLSSCFPKITYVTWDTDFVASWTNREPMIDKYGGGTDIAQGIAYIQKKYQPKSQDALVVISDFCDILTKWEEELVKIKAKKIGVNWNPEYEIKNPGFEKIFNQSPDCQFN